MEANPNLASLLEYYLVKTVEKPLHARHANLLLEVSDRIISKWVEHPTERNLLYFLILPKILSIGLSNKGLGGLSTVLKAYPSVIPPTSSFQQQQPPPKENGSHATPRADLEVDLEASANRASLLVEQGLIGRAARAITSPSVLAKPDRETFQQLAQKHPIGKALPFSSRASPTTGRPIVDKDIIKAIASFNTDTATGLNR